MCNHCIESFTNSKFISKDKPTRLFNRFPCGYCADCIRKKRSEWRLRAYYEAKRCFEMPNSFVLFDTLTYTDMCLPYLPIADDSPQYGWLNWSESWHYAFSRKHIKDFLKRLRTNLTRSGYDVKGKLRYLMSSEYGTSELTKGVRNTHRPHYHFLFYVNFDIDPLVLSRFVSQSWIYGKTDGLKPYDDCSKCPCVDYCKGYCIYKSSEYVLNERVIRGSSGECLKLAAYVSKYIGKDMYLYRKLYGRVYRYFCKKYENIDWQRNYELRLEFNRLKRQVLPFHLQSLGFGLSALDYEDKDYITNNNAIRMPISNKGVVASIPLCHYYKYKLYFQHYKIDGKVVYRPKDNYYQVKLQRLEKDIINLRNELYLFDNSLTIGRCTRIAEYAIVYRGVICPADMLELSMHDFYLRTLRYQPLSELLTSGRAWYNHNTLKARLVNGSYVSESLLPCYFGKLENKSELCNSFSLVEFIERLPSDWLFIDQQLSRFEYYDDILSSYYDYKSSISDIDDAKAYDKDKLAVEYKDLGLLK